MSFGQSGIINGVEQFKKGLYREATIEFEEGRDVGNDISIYMLAYMAAKGLGDNEEPNNLKAVKLLFELRDPKFDPSRHELPVMEIYPWLLDYLEADKLVTGRTSDVQNLTNSRDHPVFSNLDQRQKKISKELTSLYDKLLAVKQSLTQYPDKDRQNIKMRYDKDTKMKILCLVFDRESCIERIDKLEKSLREYTCQKAQRGSSSNTSASRR